MKLNIDKIMTSGSGFFILGVLWLITWLGPAFLLFEEDPRWGHNFALPILFIIVGLAFYTNKNSTQLTASFASYLTIPISLAFISWDLATIIATLFLIVFLIFYFVEKNREKELIKPNPRLNFWIKRHMMTFAYIGLVHMSLIFYLVRWFNPNPFLTNLPIEHHVSTSIFNAMLFVLTIIAIMEQSTKKLGKISVPKLGFVWSILMIILPSIAIAVLGE
jgi:cyanate permease